jgi:AraC-like DNA-binding protein/uncharacterized RmlC-like cupin family protein
MKTNRRKSLQPKLKKVVPSAGNSFYVKRFIQTENNSKPYWHFHPEIELVYINYGQGKRHIGNHISYYHDGDLLLIGSNVPHYGFAGRLTKNESEIIVQFLPDFLGSEFLSSIEMKEINLLIQKSVQGLSFSGTTKAKVGIKLIQLLNLKGFDRLIKFLEILRTLALSKEVEILNAGGMFLEVYANEHDRMTLIYDYVASNFTEIIELEKIASAVSMTVPSFCRYFKKVTNKTFTQYVNEYRIVHAQKLLSEQDMTIMEVSLSSGFNNISHFNKKFKLHTQKSPRDYRKELTTVIQ